LRTGERGTLPPLLPAIHTESSGALRLEGDGYRALVQADRRHATIEQPPDRFATEAVLRILLADSLLRRGGLLIHGVALAHGSNAALFTGQSGAGKSTLGHWGARGGLTLLSDELVAVVPEGDRFVAHGTPWNVGGNMSARLSVLGLLRHARDAQLGPIEPSAVLRVLLSNLVEPAETPSVRAQLFQIAGRLLAATAARELSFAPDPGAAEALKAAL
jgi:hypothetical protein